jgi:hypothetical protein
MKHLLPLLLCLIPLSASAKTLEWQGTLVIPFDPKIEFRGTGLATVGDGGDAGMHTFRVRDGISGHTTIPVTDPVVSFVSVMATVGAHSIDIRASETKPIAVTGDVYWCFLFPGCGGYIRLPLSGTTTTYGIGVGGTVTANTFSPGNGPKQSVQGAPWVVQRVRGPFGNQHTTSDIVKTAEGRVVGGILSLVTPMRVNSTEDPEELTIWGSLMFRFVPEPRSAPMLLAGVLGLLVVARWRYGR